MKEKSWRSSKRFRNFGKKSSCLSFLSRYIAFSPPPAPPLSLSLCKTHIINKMEVFRRVIRRTPMASFSKPVVFLFLFFFFFSTHSSHAASVLDHWSSSEWQDGNDGKFPWGIIAEEDLGLPSTGSLSKQNSSFVLALERTKRKDPTKLFNYYSGGWNLSDEHYWASASFSALPVFAIGFAWFFGFGLVLFLICCCSCCCGKRRRFSYSPYCFALSLLLLIVLTCTAMIGCIVLHNNQEKFHNSTKKMLDYAMSQSNSIVKNLNNFSRSMAGAKSIGVHQVFLPANLQTKIGETVKIVTISADELSSRASMNFSNIDNFLKSVRIDLIVGSIVMLLLVFLGFLFSILGLQFLVYCSVLIGWILIASACILCGVLILLHNVVGDTCIAMDEWVLKPQAGTALDDILPCIDASTANASLLRTKEVTFALAKVVNEIILNVSNAEFQFPSLPSSSNYNQSGPLIPMLCNPYEPDFSEHMCRPDEVSFEEAPQAWRGFICNTTAISGEEICSTVGRITPNMYGQMTAAVSSCQSLYQFNPFLEKMADCGFARETFSLIGADNCPRLDSYSKGMYCSLTVFTASVMLSLIFWMVHVGERWRHNFWKQFITKDGQSAHTEVVAIDKVCL